MFETVEAAAAAGKLAFEYEDGNGFETFHVEHVRQAKLSDFFKLSNLVSDLRENMAEKCGDDSVMDTRYSPPDGASNEGPKVFSDPQLEGALGATLDEFAVFAELDLSALMIVEARHEVRSPS